MDVKTTQDRIYTDNSKFYIVDGMSHDHQTQLNKLSFFFTFSAFTEAFLKSHAMFVPISIKYLEFKL